MGNIMQEWNALSYQSQIDVIKAGLFTQGKRYGLQVLTSNGREMQDFINETFVRVLDPERLEKVQRTRRRAGKPEISLTNFVFMQANSAISYLVNQDRRHESHRAGEIELDNLSVEDIAEAINTKVDLMCFLGKRDNRDKTIIMRIVQGYTEREIGAELGISGPAVDQRHKRIRQDATAAA